MNRSGRRCLVIIDVQNDFCPGGALAVRGGDEIISVINSIALRFETVVATQDWHPAGHVSFASARPGHAIHDFVTAGGIDQILWPDHCIQGSHGAALHERLDMRPIRLIIRKGFSPTLDSYSAFFENDRTTPTGLGGFLSGISCDDVYFTGLATDYCVLYSALDAARLGLAASVVTDAVRGVDLPPGSVRRSLEAMSDAGVRLVRSREIE